MPLVDPNAETIDGSLDALESIEARVQTWMAAAHSQLETIGANPRATLRPDAMPSGVHRKAQVQLEALARGAQEFDSRLELRELLGRGGMGEVHLALQRSMDRLVAVKTARRSADTDPQHTARLVREAMITGALEHPNVVPIYDVQLDAEGLPRIVMRRVDGRPWSELMHDAEELARRGAPDPLEWNLRILMRVCDALELAHSRHIVHRDIKPDNIMIGRYGEVYVLDWGLAVAIDDEEDVSSAGGMVGTPAYMAPEMLGTPRALSPRTDVYLLGATLFEIVVGRAPHAVQSVRELFASVIKSEPDLPDDVPTGLSEIVRRAMERLQERRFESVAQLRAALDDYLRLRGSERLTEQASARAHELAEAQAAGAARGRLYELFGECRFGLREALVQWPQSPRARDALVRATRVMIERELADGDARAAALLLAELESPPQELADAVAEAEAEATRDMARREALEKLSRDLDPAVGQRTRWRFASACGAVWTVLPVASAWRVHVRADPMLPWELIVWPIAMLLGVATFAAIGRRSLARSAINRRMVGVLLVALAAMVLSHVGLLMLGLDVPRAQVVDMLIWVGVGAGCTGFVDRSLWPLCVFFALAFLASAAWPDGRFFVLAACNLCCALTFFWVWRPSAKRPLTDD